MSFLTVNPTFELINPWKDTELHLLGLTHCHTNYGVDDGDLTREQVEADYITRGHSFIALTGHHALTPDPAAGLIFISGQEVAQSTPTTSPYHIVGLNLAEAVPEVYDVQTNINSTLARTDIVILAHALNDAGAQALTGYTHIELTHTTGLWDRNLTAGRRIWGILADDTHYPYIDGVTPLSEDWSGAVVVNVDVADATSILNALRIGNFYSTCSQDNMTRPTCYINQIIAQGRTIRVVPAQSSTIVWYKANGVIVRTTAAVTTFDEYTVVGDEQYLRTKVICTADSTRYAYSQPVFINRF